MNLKTFFEIPLGSELQVNYLSKSIKTLPLEQQVLKLVGKSVDDFAPVVICQDEQGNTHILSIMDVDVGTEVCTVDFAQETEKTHLLFDFNAGVVSDKARLYWLEKLSKEFESQSDDEYIHIIEIINKVLKGNLAKEYWQERFYTKKEIYEMMEQCDSERGLRWDEVEQWFNKNKKKQ